MNAPNENPASRWQPERGLEKQHKALNPTTKIFSLVQAFLDIGDRGMNCFEAANRHHDYVLRSSISELQQRHGLIFFRREEPVPNHTGGTTRCMRYWIAPQSRQRASELVGDRNPTPGKQLALEAFL